MNFFKIKTYTAFLTAILTASAIYWSGCSNPANSSGSGIVCKEGEAWIIDGTEGGYVFAPNGDMRAAAISDGRWYDAIVGTYTTSGDKLTTVVNGEAKTTTYKVSGGKLTLSGEGDSVTFTKRSVVNADNNNGGGESSYEFVSIGGNRWMRKNLNIATADSWCYGNDTANCNTYGRLYTWEAAKTACGSVGMRLPSREDWADLVEEAKSGLGGDEFVAKLKARSGWKSDWSYEGNGTNETGFSALPGGAYNYTGFFGGIGEEGYWWTSTESSDDNVYFRWMDWSTNYYLREVNASKNFGLSVRCVKDE
jgi:uncharacterized protein (TIGR02145 family)